MVKVDCGGAAGSAESAGALDAAAPPSPHGSFPPARLHAGFCRFEVCETSERAASARLSASLIEILADGARRAGGPSGWEALARHLTELQEAEVRRVRKLLAGSDQVSLPTGPLGSAPNGGAPRHVDSKRVRAAALAELAAGADASNSLGVSASSMLLSGFDPIREPRLVELLRRLEEVRLTSLGSFKLPLLHHHAVSVFGQPDPTNSLPEGHVCVVVDGMELAYQMCTDGDGRGGGDAPEVLIHKSPGCHAGDVRKLKHTRTPELEALLRGVDRCRAHTVFFSTRGERAIADTIAGCDHDGDKFTVISDPLLVRLFAEAPPWDAPPCGRRAATTPDADPRTLQRQLISQVLKVRYKSSPLVGQSALSLMALADEAGLGDARVQELIDVYYTALDVGVTGEVLTSLPSRLCPRTWPEWMRGRSKRANITYRPSPPLSILGRLHGSLQQVLAEASARQTVPVICDPMLHLEGSERCVCRSGGQPRRSMRALCPPLWPRDRHSHSASPVSCRFHARWRKLHEQYGRQMARVIEECAGEGGEQQRRRIAELQSTYRSMLLETYEGEDCLFGPVVNPPDRLLLEVSAIYHVTYQAARGRQAAASSAPPVTAHTAACELPAMGSAGPMSQPAAASCSSSHGQSQRAHAGTGLSFVWAVAGDFLEIIKCRAMQLELCERRGDHIAPKMHMARNMRLLLSRR